MNASCIVTPISAFNGERRTYQSVSQSFSTHAHDHYVFGVVREGERMLELNGNVRRICADDLIIFNPGDMHGCKSAKGESFAYDSVTVPSDFFGSAKLRFPERKEVKARCAFVFILELLDELREDEAIEALAAFGSILEERMDSTISACHRNEAIKLAALLKGNLSESISICDFAESEGISPYALVRAYKRIFSITPIQHLLSLRTEAACELLAKGAKAADIASELGFADQAHLTRVFKQRMGITPAAYSNMVGVKAWLS